MTGTSVKDVSGLMNYFNQTKVPSEKTKDDGFSAVLNNTTAGNQKSTASGTEPASTRSDKSAAGESLKEKGVTSAGKTRVKKSVDDKVSFSEDEEKAAEMLGAGIVQILEKLAELFGMPEKEIAGVMEQLGIAETELLNRDSLSALVPELGGAQDSLALLTNGDLYEKYTAVLEQLDGLLAEVKEAFLMDDAQLAEAVENLQDPEEAVFETPIPVEITVEESEDAEASDKMPKQENAAEEAVFGKQNLTESPQTAERPSANKEHQESKQNHEDSSPAFVQSFKAEDMQQAQAVQSAEEFSVWDTDTQDIMRQIMDYMKIQVKSDVSNLEMQLHPASLGTVQIQLVSKGGAVSAHFITENEAVRATLESQLVQLKESFAEQGVKVEAVEVSVQTHEFERNLDQGRGRQQEDDGKKAKSGRIRMRGAAIPEEEETLPTEEMQINGSTVNYTA